MYRGRIEYVKQGLLRFFVTREISRRTDVVERAFNLRHPPSRRCFVFAVPGTSTGLSDIDSFATEITNVVIGNLGGTGTYKDVVSMAPGADMQCTDTSAACVQEVINPFGPTGLLSSLVCMLMANLSRNSIWFVWQCPFQGTVLLQLLSSKR